MSTNPLRTAVIIGSTRPGRFGPTVAEWFAAVARRRDDIELDVVDLADAELPAHFGHELAAATVAAIERLEVADAFVVVTPEYNHGYPASLKQLIDLSGGVWTRKPVAFVSYGGLSGGLRAVEQLRLVFAEARAMTVRETVSFHMFPFDEAGQPHDSENTQVAADALLDDLVWWAGALRAARRQDTAPAESAA